MFTISDGRDGFYQWDIDVRLNIDSDKVSEVHFVRSCMKEPLTVKVDTSGDVPSVEVPNILLQTYGGMQVYAYVKDGDSNYTLTTKLFDIEKRPKPVDYVYKPTEVITFDTLRKELLDKLTKYLPLSGGRLTGKLLSRDLYVGGDFNEEGDYDPAAGKGKSRLTVSGTLELWGEVKAKLSTFHMKALEVLNETKLRGSLQVDKEARIKESLKVDNDLQVDGCVKIGESLDMKGNDIKNVQSIEVEGTSNLKGDVKFKPNTNRDTQVKLSDALNEALDYTFKNRIYVADMLKDNPDATFTDKLQAAIEMAPDGGVVYIPYSEEKYTVYIGGNGGGGITLDKNITIMGDDRKPTLEFLSPEYPSALFGINGNTEEEITIRFKNLVINDDVTTNNLILSENNIPISKLVIENCDFSDVRNINVSCVREFQASGSVFDRVLAYNDEESQTEVNKISILDCVVNGVSSSKCVINEIIVDNTIFNYEIYPTHFSEGMISAVITNSNFVTERMDIANCIFHGTSSGKILCINCHFNGVNIGDGDVTLIGCDTNQRVVTTSLKYGTPVALNNNFSTIPIINSDGVERYILVGTNKDMLTDLTNSLAVKIEDDGEGNVTINGLRIKKYEITDIALSKESYVYRTEDVVMTVTTSPDVESFKVLSQTNNEQKNTATYVVDGEQKVWTITFKALLIGTQDYTVTGYGADGTPSNSMVVSIKITLF